MSFRNLLYGFMVLTVSSSISHAMDGAGAAAARVRAQAEQQARADQAKRDAEWRRIQAQWARQQQAAAAQQRKK